MTKIPLISIFNEIKLDHIEFDTNMPL